ncbi:hypothetical protein [Hyalangium gracile]|uniref:hypothetical protein n=1 Tax=Hyalangium gracile TaxID=394092 RepID=UPI001CC9DD05|nr:hypothetical protein [Hyalangium gracile]
MDVWKRCARTLLVVIGAVGVSCTEKEPAGPQPIEFEREPLAAHCFSSAAISSLFPLGEDPDTFLMHFQPTNGPSSSKVAALLTRDGGRTFEKLVHEDVVDTSGEGSRPVGGIFQPPVLMLSDDFYLAGSIAGVRGLSDGTSIPEYSMELVLDGRPLRTVADKLTLTLADGARSDLVYKGDARRWVARGGGFLYATRDAGRNWQRIAPANLLQPESRANLGFVPLAATADRAVHVITNDGNRAYYSTPGATPQPLDLPGVKEARLLHVTGAFWGGKLAISALISPTEYSEVLVTEDMQTWTKLEVAKDGPLMLQLHVDRQDRLWAYPLQLSPGQRFLIYRWDPGQTRPKIIDLDAGVAMSAMNSFSALADGRFRFLGTPDTGLSRYTQPRVICEAGPGVTPRFETMDIESLDALDTGRIIRVERLQVGSAGTDRMAFSPAGKVYATGYQSLLRGPPDMPFLYESGLAHEDGIPFAPFDATETGVWVTFSKALALNSPPYDNLVKFDTQRGARATSQRLPIKATDIFQVREARGRKLYHVQEGTFFADRLKPEFNEEPPPKYPREMVVSGRHGALIDRLDYYRLQSKKSQWALRFDPLKGAMPSLESCTLSPRPAGCIDVTGTLPADAEFGGDGTLYLLDYNYGRVLALPPEANAFVEVARGFATPSDLVIREVGGKEALFVYDGDVYAFRPELGVVKVRGAGEPTSMEKAVYGKRDARDCMSGHPCLDEPPQGVLDVTASACATGRDLGDTPGTVKVGAVTAQVESWSATRVCFRPGEKSVDGLLRVVTADGRYSNRIAVRLPMRIDRWEVPASMPIDGTFRIVGHNLSSLSAQFARIVARGETALVLAPIVGGENPVILSRDGTALEIRSVMAVPRMAHGCRVGANELCELLGAGLGDGGTGVDHLASIGFRATVGGRPATITRWSDERVSLFLPAGITPGVHPVVLHSPRSGVGDITTELEVLAVAPEILVTDGPTPGALRYYHSRPVRTGDQVLVPVDRWAYGTQAGIPTPLQLDTLLAVVGTWRRDGFPPGHAQPVRSVGGAGKGGSGLHVVETNDGVVQVTMQGSSVYVADIHRHRLPTSAPETWSSVKLGELGLPFGSNVQVAGAGLVAGRLVAVLSNLLDNRSTLFDVEVGPSTATVASSTQVAFSPIFRQPLMVSGVHVAPQGVYLGNCRLPGAGATLHFVPVTVGSGGALSFGAMQTVLSNPSARLIACTATSDGLLWVMRDGSGEHVEEHRASTGVTRLGTLPASLPGVGDTWTYSSAVEVAGVADMQRLPDGDLLLAVNEQNTEPRGLRLARLKSDMSFTLSPLVLPGTLAQPGERCVGPASDRCERPAGDGCAPFACSMRPWQRVERATDYIGTAWIVPVRPGDTTATVAFEVTATGRTRGYLYGGTDAQAVRLPIP